MSASDGIPGRIAVWKNDAIWRTVLKAQVERTNCDCMTITFRFFATARAPPAPAQNDSVSSLVLLFGYANEILDRLTWLSS